MSDIPNISALLDQHLLAKREAEGERPVAGGKTWRASRLGSCLKRQYIEAVLKRPRDTPDAHLLKKFEVGNQWSRQFATWFREMGFYVEEEVVMFDDDLDVGANGDFVVTRDDVGILGIELKSMASPWFKYRAKEQETTANPEHMVQAATYDVLSRRVGEVFPWIVLTVSKDNLWINQDVIEETHRQDVLHRLEALNSAKETQIPPSCTCKDGWEWQQCSYWGGNLEERAAWLKLTPYQRKQTPKPDGECCVI